MSALVGLDDLVLALVLAAVDPAIGGVLLRGDKGSAKTTAARALASLLPAGAPFVEIPLGATEDRVVGSVDVAAILAEGEHRFQAGLLGSAHGGVLYVDEVNLLADHLVDVLLDVATSGVNRVERDGVSHLHESRFVLIGSMNPEEGELRPQLLDRFGLSVRVSTPSDPEARAEAVRRRMAFDADPARFVSEWSSAEVELASRLRAARPVPLEPGLERAVAELCVAAGAEGLRADLVICRAAGALAGWRGKEAAGEEEIVIVAPFALAHRRRTPFGGAAPDPAELDELMADALGSRATGSPRPSAGAASDHEHPGSETHAKGEGSPGDGSDAGAPGRTPSPSTSPSSSLGTSPRADEPPPVDSDPSGIRSLLGAGRRPGGTTRAGRGRSRESAAEGQGRLVGTDTVSVGGRGPLAPGATAVAAVVRTSGARPLRIEADDVRLARRERRGDNVIVLAVDTSGSMGATERVTATRDAVLALVADAYQRRDRVALVAYRDQAAEVVLRPTSSTEVALARLRDIATGGRTPLSAGIDAARALALEDRRAGSHPVVVVVTDGRATWASEGRDPVLSALESARACRVSGLDALVVDCEATSRPLGVARTLAEAMGARYVAMGGSAGGGPLSGGRLADAIVDSMG
jgi:magnesium chelatase subunit D